MAKSLLDLETPCLIADRGRIEANAGRMLARAEAHGFRLRPHVKTTKSAPIAEIAHGGRKGPITVSTLKEADYFLGQGFGDITYAVCITPNKFRHAADIVDRGADLKVLAASASAARGLAEFAGARKVPIKVLLEIDSGEHRTGFAPQADELPVSARHVTGCAGLHFEGLLTHGGHSYGATTRQEIVAIAEQERLSLLAGRQALADADIEVRVLSSGSTPTAMFGETYAGLDELRPGVYLAGDLFQAQIGSVSMEDIAISVLASVVAHDPARNSLVIDAGALALSKDRSTQKSPVDYGYGLLTRADGSRFPKDLVVTGVHQEHGEVTCDAPMPYEELPIGAVVRVLPNHVCMTAASYGRYHVTDGEGLTIVDEWDKTRGW